jgi:hypothetical protein
MRKIRSHLTYANVMVTILAFVVLGGTAAAAMYVVSSNSQIGPNTISGHKPLSGQHANIVPGSVNGTDIADRSGVDTCPPTLTVKLGPICAGGDGVARVWFDALHYCSRLGLRLPTIAEGVTLAENYNVPGLPAGQEFWMQDTDGSTAAIDDEAGDSLGFVNGGQPHIYTVCVTDPSA